MKKLFNVKWEDDFAQLGCLEKGAPATFQAFTGMGTAHDCLEHFKGDSGSVDDEFQALGCALWIRGYQGYFRNGVEFNMASECVNLWRYFTDGVPMKSAGNKKLEFDYYINGIIEEAKLIMKAENFDNYTKKTYNPFYESMKYWMQIGLTKAKVKFKYPGKTVSLFQDIEDKIDKKLKHAEEGDEIHVSYKLNDFQAKVIHLDYYDLHPEMDN